MKDTISFNFIATGVGSVPFTDVDSTCRFILKHFIDMPFWPQFVIRSPLEDMSIQASQGLPFLALDHEKKVLHIYSSDDQENELIAFYEHVIAENIDYFAIDHNHAAGLYKLLELIEKNPQNNGPFIKGQIVGPITFAGGLTDIKGKAVLHNSEMMEALVKGLAMKALWLVKKMSVFDKIPILFLDEPYLSGFGSAFTPIQREAVLSFIREVIDYIRSRSDALIGIHCCGNTDWSMIIDTGVDIINFDAFDYMDYFLLYRCEIITFIDNGGTIAWGAVPTTSFTGDEDVRDLKVRLDKGLTTLCEWGIDRKTVAERSIITPACGVGSLEPDKATKIFELTSSLSSLMSGLDA